MPGSRGRAPGSALSGEFTDVDPALDVVADGLQLGDGEFDGAVGAAGGGEDGLETLQALIQIDIHTIVDGKGADLSLIHI